MKMIKLTVVLCFCSSVVFAETTLEMIQKRAEAGDATAQTLMGMMASDGCQVSRDREASQKWYQRAADQGDSFAVKLVLLDKKQLEVSKKSLLTFLSKDELEKKVAEASSAEYKGSATMEDLLDRHKKYIGKVVRLKFETSGVSTTFEAPCLFVRDHLGGRIRERLMLCGPEALEWAVKESKSGSSSEAYVLVDKNGLLALGVNRTTVDGVCTYSW